MKMPFAKRSLSEIEDEKLVYWKNILEERYKVLYKDELCRYSFSYILELLGKDGGFMELSNQGKTNIPSYFEK